MADHNIIYRNKGVNQLWMYDIMLIQSLQSCGRNRNKFSIQNMSFTLHTGCSYT